ncbi:hypothetical protein FHS72_001748 [Loktanella ponticola]|uniref:Exopolysaccharide biosynthesis protein n=1 Tax=Yoonia ponticola TaxID=1524255 RepID=A0A7W9EXY4_9RHOB|nr:exopolysaccharide biosynthesis protein [Yoonia ponticola]MBB5722124.1 hypothetical protein [Yoonia ponticola]
MTDDTKADPITDIATHLTEASHGDAVTFDDLLQEFGREAFATCLLVAGVVLASPLSGVPFASSIFGALICLISAQAAYGAKTIWLPAFLRKRSVSADKIERLQSALETAGKVFDKFSRDRITGLVGPKARRVLYAVCAVGGLCLPLLEIVPFSSSVVGLGVALVSLGILGRDGLFALIGVPVILFGMSIPFWVASAVLG